MKTTVEIAKDLFMRSREVAQREGTTPYYWPDLSVDGEGLTPEIEEGSWEPLCDRIYAVGTSAGSSCAGEGDAGAERRNIEDGVS
jgi:hypothetical protein